ncbi:MAG TPA: PDR/VanB family oxidoreductase [Xanthobacteraceae bacterium]|nr:PDR/VanB family oxidoreductase [Xanthobacteraceae bacterium]
MAASSRTLRVQAMAWETDAIRSIELRDPRGVPLPPFSPGAHIDLTLPGKLKRSYSLIGSPEDRSRYEIGVYREPQSRGGSIALHDQIRVGDLIESTEPANNFELREDASHSVFIAGGIGITPFLPMVERLGHKLRPFELHYCARDRASAGFVERLRGCGPRLHVAYSREPGGCRIDIAQIVAAAPEDTHLYCCGPKPMLEDFERATSGRDPAFIHVEHFTPVDPPALAGGYLVELARAGRTVAVPPGKTLLQTLLDEGFDVPCSCLEGVCGTCETRVLAGVPDHRDVVLSKEERAAGNTMMICCSGAKSERLVLDL